MGHEKTLRVIALEAEVERIKDLLREELGRYKVAYVSWQLSGRSVPEAKYGWEIFRRVEQLRLNLRKAYDLLAEVKQEAMEK